MILYHGSNIIVEKPDLNHSRLNLDFGCGFYTTPLLDQAIRWCNKFINRNESGYVSSYNFDENKVNKLKVKNFTTYSEEWLDFIISCRSGIDNTNYDLIIGGVANDKVFNTLELYFDGLINKNEAIKRLVYEKPNLQVCFKTQKALDFLKFLESKKYVS